MGVFWLVTAVVLAASCGGKAARDRAAGAVRLRSGDVGGALASLRAAAEAAPRDPEIWTLLGDAQFEAQRYEEADRSYRTALEHDPRAARARRHLAQLALRRGRRPEAERLIREVVAQRPRDPDSQLALGNLLAARDDLGGAQAAFAAALARAPRHQAALYDLGRVLLRQGEVDRAEAAFVRLGEVAPRAPYGPYGRALVAAHRQQAEAACEALAEAVRLGLADRRAVERDPELAPIRRAPCVALALASLEGVRR
jgi:tetratricopeptide (TPR) repeat protein